MIATSYFLNLQRQTKQLVVIFLDFTIATCGCSVASGLLGGTALKVSVTAILVASFCFTLNLVLCGCYKNIFRYFGRRSSVQVLLASLQFMLALVVFGWLAGDKWTLVQTLLLGCSFSVTAIILLRSLAREFLGGWNPRKKIAQNRFLVFGADLQGRRLRLTNSGKSSSILCSGFIDDDPTLIGGVVDGLKVYSLDEIDEVVFARRIDGVIVPAGAMHCDRLRCAVKEFLRLELIIRVQEVGEIFGSSNFQSDPSTLNSGLSIELLLGRDEVSLDANLVAKEISGKSVLITGAGGSIGSELCRQIAKCEPERLIFIDNSEYALFSVVRTLEEEGLLEKINEFAPVLLSISEDSRIRDVIKRYDPQIIYHAAAYKHVHLCEQNISSAIANNIFGTAVLANAAVALNVPKFVLISSDKAVRPTSVMGATKRVAELYLQALHNSLCGSDEDTVSTCFSMVRFGNVLGSSGSVIPLFERQIQRGGPVTVTDSDVTRFFMTVAEAASLVIHAGFLSNGGEVFILDMGDPIKIRDLARKMIKASGFSVRDEVNPEGDIEIKYIGLRSGEKLYEELLLGDSHSPTGHPKIKKALEPWLTLQTVEKTLLRLKELVDRGDSVDIRFELEKIVGEHK